MKRRLVRALLGFLLILMVAGALGVLIVSRNEALKFVHPQREVLMETPAEYGLEYEEVMLKTEDGLTLRGWYVPGTNGAAIIAQHGYGASRQGVLGDAAVLSRQGYSVLMFDWRGHGESEGNLVTFGIYEIRDVQAALDWIHRRPEVDPQRIGGLGESMGAVALLYATARLPEIKAVVAVSPFPSLRSEVEIGVRVQTGLPTFPFAPLIVWFAEREAGIPVASLDLTQDIGQISPRPVFLLHGGLDSKIPPNSGDVLFRAAGEPKAYWFDPEVGHTGFVETYPQEYERRVSEFFDTWLAVARQGDGAASPTFELPGVW
jgi:fermentation-respiration switch protein FrsA (DUF1100 family)